MCKIFVAPYQDPSKGTNVLGPGVHYLQACNSIIVPPGQVVTLFDDQERRDGHWKSRPLYEGAYNDLRFFDKPRTEVGALMVEETGVTGDELTEVGWWSYWQADDGGRYPITLKLPPGTWVGGEDFEDDRIDFISVPFGFRVELFRDKDEFGRGTGGSMIFDGDEAVFEDRIVKEARLKHVALGTYGWNRVPSIVKITSDDWVDIGIEIVDSTIETDEESQFAGTVNLYNNAPDGVKSTVSQIVAKDSSDSMEENWGTTEGEVSTKGWSVDGTIEQGVNVTGKAGPVEIESQTKVSVTAGGHGEQTLEFGSSAGGARTTSSSTSLSSQVSLESEKQGTYKASVFIDYGIITGVAVRKLKNKRTGAIVEKRCPFRRKKGFNIGATIDGQRLKSEKVEA